MSNISVYSSQEIIFRTKKFAQVLFYRFVTVEQLTEERLELFVTEIIIFLLEILTLDIWLYIQRDIAATYPTDTWHFLCCVTHIASDIK